MPAGGWRRVTATTAAEVCRRFAPGPAAAALVTPTVTPVEFLTHLEQHGLHADGLRFLAFALPSREALWWGCLGLRSAGLDGAPLSATEKYVVTPTDANRRAAMAAAEVSGLDQPAGMVAAGAFFSGGSLGPANVPAVPPADHLTPTMVATALVLAAVTPDPTTAADKCKAFLALGRQVADGASRWPER